MSSLSVATMEIHVPAHNNETDTQLISKARALINTPYFTVRKPTFEPSNQTTKKQRFELPLELWPTQIQSVAPDACFIKTSIPDITLELPLAKDYQKEHQTLQDFQEDHEPLQDYHENLHLRINPPTPSVDQQAVCIGDDVLYHLFPHPHCIKRKKDYNHEALRGDAPILHTFPALDSNSDASISTRIQNMQKGYWLLPVTPGLVPIGASEPQWPLTPFVKRAKTSPLPIVWTVHRLKAAWAYLEKFNEKFGGLNVTCHFTFQNLPLIVNQHKHKSDAMRVSGDHIRIECDSFMALRFRKMLGYLFPSHKDGAFLSGCKLAWCSLDGIPVLLA